jgi:hypothetical protein
MDLWLGSGPLFNPEPFKSDAERSAAWFAHRDVLLARHGRHGRRPHGWWSYEAGDLRYPGYNAEPATLYTAGLLGEEEARELVSNWRREFERAQQANFFHCEGPGRFLAGAAARRAHYRWAGIPRDLLREWKAQRRRQGQRARKLEAAARDPAPAA